MISARSFGSSIIKKAFNSSRLSSCLTANFDFVFWSSCISFMAVPFPENTRDTCGSCATVAMLRKWATLPRLILRGRFLWTCCQFGGVESLCFHDDQREQISQQVQRG